MPGFRFEVTRGVGLRAAPRMPIRAGDLEFRLLDASGSSVPNAAVEFHVLAGGAMLQEPDAYGVLADVQLARTRTDAGGVARAPQLVLGPWEGPNEILVQSAHAVLVHRIPGTFANTILDVVDPPLPARSTVAGRRIAVSFRARDTGYGDAPVPSLPLEIEVIAGAATLDLVSGGFGCYDLRRTAADGFVRCDADLSRHAERTEIRARVYQNPRVAAATLAIDARSPALLSYSALDHRTVPVGSIPPAVRTEVSDSPDAFISPDDRDIDYLWVEGKDPAGLVDVHPPANATRGATASFALYCDTETGFTTSFRLPDFPDTPKIEPHGRFQARFSGAVPALNTPTILPSGLRSHILLQGGGNADDLHHVEANLTSGALQYLGPNATSSPIRITVDVLPPQGSRRLVEARVKARVRLTPFNSILDDPAAGAQLTPGSVSESPAGPWSHEVEIAVAGAPGPHDVTLFFQSNERNYDTLVDVTAEVTMEDEDSNGNLFQFDEDSTIQLRAILLRPRLLVTREEGADFVPVAEEAIRPVTSVDANGFRTPLPAESAFRVELLCHDIGPNIGCSVATPNTERVVLQRVEVRPECAVYRSEPCYAVVDDRLSGAASAQPPTGVTFLETSHHAVLRAWIDSEMPGNTLQPNPVRYSIGTRPISAFNLLTAGEESDDRPPRPSIYVEIAEDGSVPVDVSSGRPELVLRVEVRDVASDLSGFVVPDFEINGSAQGLTWTPETPGFGRPLAGCGVFDGRVPVEWGAQVLTVRAKNRLDIESERKFTLEVRERTNDRWNPVHGEASLHPIDAGREREIPAIRYLYFAGTPLDPGASLPPSVPAEVEGLGISGILAVTMTPRPSAANHYASMPFLTARSDYAVAAYRPDVVGVPFGGRIEWRASALPNRLGPIALSNRRRRNHRSARVERLENGQWVDLEGAVRNGDEIRIRVRSTDSTPSLMAEVAVCDLQRRVQRGEARRAYVLLERTSGGDFELARYYDENWSEQPATSIVIVDHHAEDGGPGRLTLRTAGPGRFLSADAIGSGWADIDVPLVVEPRRHEHAGEVMSQEGAGSPGGRIGALESVVPGSGELVLSAVDREIEGRGLSVSVQRTYRSGVDFAGPHGHGWIPSWGSFIWRISSDRFRLLDAEGQIVDFDRTASGVWEPSPGFNLVLEDHEGWLAVAAPQGARTIFVAAEEGEAGSWVLAATEDRYGNAISILRPAHGRAAALADPFGRTLSLLWNEVAGRVERLGDFSGSDVVYTSYGSGATGGAEGNLQEVRSPLVTNPDNPFPDGRKERYTYVSAAEKHRLRSYNDAHGVADALPPLVTIDYHPDGKVRTQTFVRGGFRFDWSGDRLTWHDRKDHGRTVDFDPAAAGGAWARLPVTIIETVGGVDRTHALTWDPQRQLQRIEMPSGRVAESDFDHGASDPRDRGNLLRSRLLPDGVRPTEVTRTLGVADFRSDPGEITIGEITTWFETEPGLQELSRHIDALARESRVVWNGPFREKDVLPAAGHAAPGHPPQTTRESRYEWNHWGQLLSVVDANGVATRFWYYRAADPTGSPHATLVSAPDLPGGLLARVERDVSDPNAQRAAHLAARRTVRVDFIYDLLGRRISDGRGASMEYNELGDLIRLVGPEGEDTRYRYDANGRLVDQTERVVDIAAPSGHAPAGARDERTHFEYERDDLAAERVVDADGLALRTTWEYDPNGNCIFERSPRAHAASQPQPDNVIRWDYDEADQVEREVTAPGSAHEVTVEFGYTEDGQLESERYVAGRVSTFVYDGFGRRIGSADALGNAVDELLDETGNLTRRRVRGSIDGDPAHRGTLADEIFFYDEADRLIARSDRSVAFYPGSSGPSEEILGSGFRVGEFWYDAMGYNVRTLDSLGLIRTITPDAHGLAWKIEDSEGSSVTWEYDDTDQVRRLEQSDPIGTSFSAFDLSPSGYMTSASDYRGVVERNYYDSAGRVRYTEDPLGNRVEYRYDGASRRSQVLTHLYEGGRRLNADGSESGVQQTLAEQTTYWENGLIRSHRDAANVRTELFEYLPNDLLERRTFPEDALSYRDGSSADPNPGPETESYAWRADGLLHTTTTAAREVIENEYDAAGRLTGSSVTGGHVAGTRRLEYVVDGMGRTVQAADDNGAAGIGSEVTRLFTTLGAVCWERQREDLGGQVRESETRAEYRENGTRVLLRYPSGRCITRIVPNAYGAPRFVADNVPNETVARYGWHGRIYSHRTFPNGVNHGIGYDSDKEPFEVRTYRGTDFSDDANLLAGKRFVYDPAGRPTKEQDLGTGSITKSSFDSLGRIDSHVSGYSAANPGATPTSGTWWIYDARGNVIRGESGAIGGRTSDGRLQLTNPRIEINDFNEANQIQERTIIDLSDPTAITTRSLRPLWDRKGNLLEDERFLFRYDFRNRLIEAEEKSGGARHRLYYDALGRCVRVGDRRWTYWGFDRIEENPDAGNWYKLWVYGPQPGELLAYESNISGSAERFYLHTDRAGGVQFLSDASGRIRERYDYDPFGTPFLRDASGNPITPAAGTGQPFLMHGRYYYADLDLYQVGPRILHPLLDRFMQRDPGGALADPMTHGNPYVFAANNPLAYTDDGRLAWFIPVIYVGVTAALALAETKLEEMAVDRWGDPNQFSFGGSYLRNVVVGLATNWIPGAAHVRTARLATRIAFRFTSRAATLGARALVHTVPVVAVAVPATAVEYAWEGAVRGNAVSWEAILAGNLLGGAIGGIAGGVIARRIARSRSVERFLIARRRLRAHLNYTPTVAGGRQGRTTPTGRIDMWPEGHRTFGNNRPLFLHTRRHELGHYRWRPTRGPMALRRARGWLFSAARERSNLVRFLDELLAETNATRSLLKAAGLVWAPGVAAGFKFKRPWVVAEGILYLGGVSMASYGGWVLGSALVDE